MTQNFEIEIGSTRLTGERSGEGESLVFLHAGVADRRMWCPQLTEFRDSRQVVAYDRRGFGETISGDEAFSHVEDLREVLDELANPAASLVGCSQGGRIAIDFALAFPGRVNALALIAPAVSGAPATESYPVDVRTRLDALSEAEEANDLARVNAIEANLWLDGPTSSDGRVSGALRELFLDMNGTALRMPEFSKRIEPPPAYEALSTLSFPTLVIWGELDFPHIKERCQHLVDTIPMARGNEISDVAHLLNLERPSIVNDLLRDFVDSLVL